MIVSERRFFWVVSPGAKAPRNRVANISETIRARELRFFLKDSSHWGPSFCCRAQFCSSYRFRNIQFFQNISKSEIGNRIILPNQKKRNQILLLLVYNVPIPISFSFRVILKKSNKNQEKLNILKTKRATKFHSTGKRFVSKRRIF